MQSPLIKICGISDAEILAHTIAAGADFVGFVHFEKSPRHVPLESLASLVNAASKNAQSVVVLVNPTNELLDSIFAKSPPDYLQLHGDESPEHVAEVKKKYGAKIIKAIAVSTADDVSRASAYENVADIILFDAKAPKHAENAGGFGVSFDWQALSGYENKKPWMLSGGLSHENIAQAIAMTHAPMVDVSSHVETPVGSGKKDIEKIRAFIRTVKASVN